MVDDDRSGEDAMPMEHLDPPGIPASPAYANGIIVSGGRMLYIGGQNGTDEHDVLLPDVAGQCAAAAAHVGAILAAAGATPAQLVTLRILLVDGEDLQAAYSAAMPHLAGSRPAITFARTSGLGRPGALVEIDATAALDPS